MFYQRIQRWASPTDDTALKTLLAALRPVATSIGLQRFGPYGDGGYLLPDDLEGVAACISPGVAKEVGFDLSIAARGIDVFLADGSIDGPPIFDPHFHFTRTFIGARNSSTEITLEDFCRSVPNGDLILQMDIEGAEYAALGAVSDDLLRRFRIMVIEFHNLHKLYLKRGFDLAFPVFSKLLRHHNVVHIHPNNTRAPVAREAIEIPPEAEFTFYRKDRDSFPPKELSFPHPLDRPNIPHLTNYALAACWQQTAG